MLTMLDEFAGTGAATLAGERLGIKTTKFVEIDFDAQQVLKHRFPNIPIHDDIRTYDPQPGEHDIHWVSFPCTGTSHAGLRTGLNHPESALWFEALRCICCGIPRFVVVEQPEGFIHCGLRAVLGGLRMAGYAWEDPQLISAAWVGSPQRRNRLFLIAYSNNLRQRFREVPTSWNDQIRAEFKAVYQPQRQATPSRARVDDGLSPWLGGRSVNGWWAKHPARLYPGIRRHTPKRRECNDLYARSVVPEVAAIALRRILYLNSLAGNM